MHVRACMTQAISVNDSQTGRNKFRLPSCYVYGDMSHDQWKTSGLVGIQSIRYTEASFPSIRLHVLYVIPFNHL